VIGFVLDHLWQSTLFAAVVGLLTLTLRSNSAQVRYYLWFAASAKFLVPFAGLTAAGSHLLAALMPPVSAPSLILLEPVAQPFSAAPLIASGASAPQWDLAHVITPLLLALWAAGFVAIAVRWLIRWSRLQRVLRQAVDCPLSAPVPVKMARSLLEPGLVGIWQPVILLPEGITERLSPGEMNAILAHEICHLRRRDNLLTAMHMLVEALFWFHPLIWWLGARLNAEREHACDESVLAQGQSPQIYAESILKVCQFYMHSPLDCAAGISGANLKQRLEEIVENKLVHRLKNTKKALLATAALSAVGIPFTLGLVQAPSAQAQTSTPAPKRDAVIQKPYTGPMPNRVKFTFTHDERGNPLALMLSADNCDSGDKGPFHCQGNIALSMPSGIVTGDVATFDYETRKLTLTGKVVMFAGINRMNGALLILDANTGVIHMNGEDVKSGYPGMRPEPAARDTFTADIPTKDFKKQWTLPDKKQP